MLLWNSKAAYGIHRSLPLTVLSLLQSFCIIIPVSLRCVLILSFHLRFRLPSSDFPLGFPPKAQEGITGEELCKGKVYFLTKTSLHAKIELYRKLQLQLAAMRWDVIHTICIRVWIHRAAKGALISHANVTHKR